MRRREIDKNLTWCNVGRIHQVPKHNVTHCNEEREIHISYSRAWCLDESHSYRGNTWASPQVTQCKTHFSPPETSSAEKRKHHQKKKIERVRGGPNIKRTSLSQKLLENTQDVCVRAWESHNFFFLKMGWEIFWTWCAWESHTPKSFCGLKSGKQRTRQVKWYSENGVKK